MYLTEDEGLIVGGSSISNISDQKTEHSRGIDDYRVIKLDSNRVIQRDKTIGGSYYDYLQAVQQTRDDGYMLGKLRTAAVSLLVDSKNNQ